jgi:hypothetical protein
MPDGKWNLEIPEMADLTTIMKYMKVRALAEQGVGGERANAQRKVAKMESENPGIREQAEAVLRAQRGEQTAPQHKPTTGNWETLFNGNWENWFAFAQQAANYAYQAAQTAVNAQYGAWLASHVSSYTRNTRSGRIIIGLRMDEDTCWQAQVMNTAQKELFRRELHQKLDEQLDAMLNQEEKEVYW